MARALLFGDVRPSWLFHAAPLLFACILPVSVAAEPREPEIDVEGDARAGYVTLRWGARDRADDAVQIYQLEEATTKDFSNARTRYQGRHTSSVISGLRDGTFYYRVRYRNRSDGAWSDWSTIEAFSVEHYSHRTAGLLFGLGAVVFLSTAGFIVKKQKEA